jgi:hypothetical protein
MIHLTPSDIKEAHYIPANNMFSFYMIDGDDAMDQAQETAQEGSKIPDYCPVCAKAWAEWYLRSCKDVFEVLKKGGKPNTNYPTLVNPCSEAKE